MSPELPRTPQVVEGLFSSGKILINDSRGSHDAGGAIYIGPIVAPDPLNDVTFDGCIRVFGGTLKGGNLLGSIDVTDCHLTDDELNMCIDRDDGGNVTITQTDCDPLVTGWSCGTCP